MAQGAPDFYTYGLENQYAAQGPLGELAARLEPFMAFDRRGDIFWFDGWEEGIRDWDLFDTATNPVKELVTDKVRLGGYALHMDTGGEANVYVAAFMDMAGHPTGNVGLTTHVAMTGSGFYFRWRVRLWDDTVQADYRIRWRDDTNRFQYYDQNQNWQNFGPTYDIERHAEMYMPAKLVVDLANREYLRFLFATQEIDMSGIPVHTVTALVSYQLKIDLRVGTFAGGVGGMAWIDSVILTGNEPA